MKFTSTIFDTAWVIDLEKRVDGRGFFARTWCRREFLKHGLNVDVVQINTAASFAKGTVRGMHWQAPPHAEVKIVSCVRGAIYDVIVDVREDSRTFGRHQSFELTAENGRMLYVPEGFAHGYQTLADDTQIVYQTTAEYAPDYCRGLRYDDPELAIDWPLPAAAVSDQDRRWPDFAAIFEQTHNASTTATVSSP